MKFSGNTIVISGSGGAILGGSLGGPVGAIIGALAGATVGLIAGDSTPPRPRHYAVETRVNQIVSFNYPTRKSGDVAAKLKEEEGCLQ